MKFIADFRRAGVPRDATPWEMVYAIMGAGEDVQYPGRPGVLCLTWLLDEATWQPVFDGVPISLETETGVIFTGDLEVRRRPGLEGHFCQWLFVLSTLGVSLDTPVRLPPSGRTGVLRNVLEGSRAHCNSASDLSWALPVLTRHYEGPWTNRFGERIDADSLARQHMKNRSTSVACFGTHWRIGIASTLRNSGSVFSSKIRDQLKCELVRCIEEARRSCDASGRLVSAGVPQDWSDAATSFQAHSLEWILMAMPSDEARHCDWVHRAVAWLLEGVSTRQFQFGTRCHVSFALRLYIDNVASARDFGRPL